MTLTELEPLIINEWAKPKGLIQHTQAAASAQHGKTVDEVGELKQAIANLEAAIREERESGMWKHRELQHQVRLEAGDVLVTLVLQSAIQKTSIAASVANIHELYDGYEQGEFSILTFCKWIGQDIGFDLNFTIRYIGGVVLEVEGMIAPYGLTLDECITAAWEKI